MSSYRTPKSLLPSSCFSLLGVPPKPGGNQAPGFSRTLITILTSFLSLVLCNVCCCLFAFLKPWAVMTACPRCGWRTSGRPSGSTARLALLETTPPPTGTVQQHQHQLNSRISLYETCLTLGQAGWRLIPYQSCVKSLGRSCVGPGELFTEIHTLLFMCFFQQHGLISTAFPVYCSPAQRKE